MQFPDNVTLYIHMLQSPLQISAGIYVITQHLNTKTFTYQNTPTVIFSIIIFPVNPCILRTRFPTKQLISDCKYWNVASHNLQSPAQVVKKMEKSHPFNKNSNILVVLTLFPDQGLSQTGEGLQGTVLEKCVQFCKTRDEIGELLNCKIAQLLT